MKKRAIFALSSVLAFAAFGCDQDVEEEQNEISSYDVEVRMNDVTNGKADLAEMNIVDVTVNDMTSKAVKLADIIAKVNGIEADKLDDYLKLYKCDFESAKDGFKSSDKGERCAPLNCSVAKEAYVNAETHHLFYTEASGVKDGCYSIKDFGAVLMYDIDATAAKIWVYLDNEGLKEVDASKLETVEIDGKKAVKLETLLKAAKADLDLSKLKCDFRVDGSDKLVSESDTTCASNVCADIKDQYIMLDNRAVNDGKDAKACYEVENVKAVYVSTISESFETHNIAIKIDGKDFATIDIASLAEKATTVNGVAAVSVDDILKAAGVDIDLAKAQCEGASLGNADAKDDYRPSIKDACKQLLSCDVFAKGTVSLTDSKMTASKDTAKCYNVTAFNTIEITTEGAA